MTLSERPVPDQIADLPRWAARALALLTAAIVLTGLALLSQRDFLPFHSLAELLCIAVAWAVFALAWRARRYRHADNGYLLVLGVSSLFVGGIDLVHTLAYKGMGVFSGHDANLPTQLWITARYLQSLSFLGASLLLYRPSGSVLRRPYAPHLLLVGYAVVTALLLAACFGRTFPTCYIEGVGLTPFKRISEYVISGLLLASMALLWQRRARLAPEVAHWLLAALAATIVAELAFTFYVSVYGASNAVGHLAKVLAPYALYRAIVLTGIQRPQAMLFEALRASEEQYRHLAENIRDYVMRYDRQHRHIYANEAAIAVAGKTREEFIGKTHREMGFPEALCALWERAIDRVFETGQPQGEIFAWDSAYGRVVLDWRVASELVNGQVETALAVSRDITAIEQAEQALREREAEQAAIYENAPLIMLLVDADRRVRRVNGFAQKFAHASAEEMIGLCAGQALRCLGHVDDPAGCGLAPQCADCTLRRALRDTLETGASHNQVETTLPFMIDGQRQEIHFLLSTTRLDISGRPMALVSLLDVTHRVQAEKALRENAAVVQTLMDAIPAPVFCKDAKGAYLGCNRAFGALRGMPEREIVGKTLYDMMPHHQAEQHALMDEALLDQPGDQVYETTVTLADGSPRDAIIHKATFNDADGQVRGIVGVIVDITEIKQAQEALARERTLLRTVIDNLPDAVYVKDAAARKVLANRADLANIGASDEAQVLGKTDLELYPAEVAARFFADDQAVLQSGEPVLNREESLANVAGEQRWLLTSKLPLRDEQGRITGLVGIGHDITRRKQAEEALARERALSWTVLANLPDPVYVEDTEGRLMLSDPADLAINDWNEDEVLGKTALELFPSNAGVGIYKEDLRVIQTGEPVINREDLLVNRAGEQRWLLVSKIPLRDEQGRITGLVGIGHDITARKQAEEALRETKDYLESLISFANAPIIVWDPLLRITRFNRAFEDLTGRAAEEVIGQSLNVLFPADLVDSTMALLNKAQAGERWEEVEIAIRHADDSARTVLWNSATIFASDGKTPIATIAQGHDITARKQAEQERQRLEEQLHHAQRIDAIGRLAGGVAHDFNNMLQTILGYAEIGLGELSPDSPQHGYLREIRNAGQRSAGLTRQLLAFARRQTIIPQELNLNDTVAGMLRMLGRLIGEDIGLVWKPAANLGLVKMDPSQIDQILANLMVNARDAIGGVGQIVIETANTTIDQAYCATHPYATPGRYVQLAVSDDGHGMDRETLDRIFEPFFTTKPIGEGTGLGLATVYGIVKQNDGFIHVYSEPGQGTTFRIYLPRHEAAPQPTRASRAAVEAPRGVETVLLVEDEQALLRLASRMLSQLGYTVLAASSPEQALRVAQEHAGEIDLLMTDVVMPGMSGRELAEQLRSLRPAAKYLYMSGYTANVIAHRGVVDEGMMFLQKPFSLDSLARTVRAALEG
jgi:PAS domain S-box-containing protein